MANIINRQQTFATNGTVDATSLHNLIDSALVNSAIIKNQDEITTIGTSDLLLIAPSSVDAALAPRKVTVQNLFDDGLTSGTFTNFNLTGALTYGTATGNRTVSTSATITTGTIQALTTGTTTSTNQVVTNGTITNLSATTSTFLGTITGSTNVINIGSGQIYKDASGNVGIGTNSPLVSAGFTSLTLNGTTSGILEIKSNGTQKGAFFNDGSLTRLRSSGTLAFDANNTEAMTIDSSGNVGIGVTPSSGFRLTSKGATATSAGYNLLCQNSSGSTCLSARDDGLITTGLLANSPFNYTTGGAANAAIFSDGNLGRSTSSIKYKKDVVNTNHGLLDVMKLRPVTYRGKSENDGNTVFGGLIAEEVHDAGLTEFVQYADDGTPDALSYGNMVSLAFRAIQEQQATIEELKNKVAALEAA